MVIKLRIKRRNNLIHFSYNDVKEATTTTTKVDDEATTAYRKIHDELLESGMYEPTNKAIFIVMSRILMFLMASFITTFLTTNYILHMIGSISLGFFWQQSLLFAHDIMHRSVLTPETIPSSKSRLKGSQMLGLVIGGACGGVGPFWWTDDHSMHHMFTNVVDLDPSAGSDPVLFCDAKMYKHNVISR